MQKNIYLIALQVLYSTLLSFSHWLRKRLLSLPRTCFSGLSLLRALLLSFGLRKKALIPSERIRKTRKLCLTCPSVSVSNQNRNIQLPCTAMRNLLTFCGYRQVWSSVDGLAGCGTGEFNTLSFYPLQWSTIFDYE